MIKKIWPSKVIVKNFRNFHDIHFALGSRITLISGQNGAGKSNLLSLIASSSGLQKKSELGSNFQPDFNDFFVIDQSEDFKSYNLYVDFSDETGKVVVRKKLTFKDDTKSNRGIRIIPRTAKLLESDSRNLRDVETDARDLYGVGGAARVPIPSIYLSLSRLYPLGEKRDNIKIRKLSSRNFLYKGDVNRKFAEWYNYVIPNTIIDSSPLFIIEKNRISKRASFYMTMHNLIPALSQSVGQDNLGNIISAFVDVYLLSLESGYRGALICIDEIDVSLHPDSQVRLFQLMDNLSKELNIQFVITSHSLTLIKELTRKYSKSPNEYKIVYLKNPTIPYVTQNTDYYSLKADLFNQLSFNPPLTKVYFEDEVGQKLFIMLLDALFFQLDAENGALSNFKKNGKTDGLAAKLSKLKCLTGIRSKLKEIPVELGCEDLIRISEADPYFKRIIVLLDGDARVKNGTNVRKPEVKDYLNKPFSQKGLDRQKPDNVCFFPGYFAPESFLYKILYTMTERDLVYANYWRSLDASLETAMYTPDKLREQLKSVGSDFNNDDLKELFKKSLWKFLDDARPLRCYYNEKNLGQLIDFWEEFLKIYERAKSLTLQNRYD